MEVTGVNDFWFFVVIETLCFLVAFKTIMFLFMISSYFWGCWRCGQDICKNAMPVLVIVKLRERERPRVNQGKEKKKKWMVDGGWWISFP